MGIHRASVLNIAVAPDVAQKELTALDPSQPLRQNQEQLELRAGEDDLDAVNGDLVSLRIDCDGADRNNGQVSQLAPVAARREPDGDHPD